LQSPPGRMVQMDCIAVATHTRRCGHARVDVTQLFSLRENAIAKEPGLS
jgi:hypothetical protein